MALAACDLADQATSFMPKLADQAASLMPKTFRQSDPAPPTVEPEPDVKELIRANADTPAHRPRRIGLRPRDARQSGQSGSTRSQMQELSTVGKFHFEPSHHSITSSANSRNGSGMVSPIDFAVLRFTTSSNFVGRSIGRSPGLAPLRILSTRPAIRRQMSGRLAA